MAIDPPEETIEPVKENPLPEIATPDVIDCVATIFPEVEIGQLIVKPTAPTPVPPWQPETENPAPSLKVDPKVITLLVEILVVP
jgi:hypothetical protein